MGKWRQGEMGIEGTESPTQPWGQLEEEKDREDGWRWTGSRPARVWLDLRMGKVASVRPRETRRDRKRGTGEIEEGQAGSEEVFRAGGTPK